MLKLLPLQLYSNDLPSKVVWQSYIVSHSTNATVQGFDIAQGATVLKARERIGAAEVGLMATIGVSHVKVTLSTLNLSIQLQYHQ